MTVQLIAAIAAICHYSVAGAQYDARGGDPNLHAVPYDSSNGQTVCQKKLIQCVKAQEAIQSKKSLARIMTESPSSHYSEGDTLAGCVLK